MALPHILVLALENVIVAVALTVVLLATAVVMIVGIFSIWAVLAEGSVGTLVLAPSCSSAVTGRNRSA